MRALTSYGIQSNAYCLTDPSAMKAGPSVCVLHACHPVYGTVLRDIIDPAVSNLSHSGQKKTEETQSILEVHRMLKNKK